MSTSNNTTSAKESLASGQSNLSDIVPNIITPEPTKPKQTMGGMIGEIVWLMTQSAAHRHLSIGDLEWILMPPIALRQYKVFRDGEQIVGAALWGYLSDEAETRLIASGRIAPQDWANGAIPDKEKGLIPQAGGTPWLVELIAPFHTEENKHREQMLADIAAHAFKDTSFKVARLSPETGRKEAFTVDNKKV